MSGDFYVGQQVVCLRDEWSPLLFKEAYPRRNQHYHIREITNYDGVTGLRLQEVVNEPHTYSNATVECAFAVREHDGAYNFKPIKKEEIEWAQELCREAERKDLALKEKIKSGVYTGKDKVEK